MVALRALTEPCRPSRNRQSKRSEAEEAWETVLRLGRGSGAIAERREARTHLVTLWIRDGSTRVATKLAQLEEYLRGQPDDEDVRHG